jgi:hypothetical protein
MLFKFKGPLLKTKPKIIFFNFYFEFLNIHINHLTKFPMITMGLKWRHKNISNKITIFKEFWWLSNMIFGLFDYDYTQIHNLVRTFLLYKNFKCIVHINLQLFFTYACKNNIYCSSSTTFATSSLESLKELV